MHATWHMQPSHHMPRQACTMMGSFQAFTFHACTPTCKQSECKRGTKSHTLSRGLLVSCTPASLKQHGRLCLSLPHCTHTRWGARQGTSAVLGACVQASSAHSARTGRQGCAQHSPCAPPAAQTACARPSRERRGCAPKPMRYDTRSLGRIHNSAGCWLCGALVPRIKGRSVPAQPCLPLAHRGVSQSENGKGSPLLKPRPRAQLHTQPAASHCGSQPLKGLQGASGLLQEPSAGLVGGATLCCDGSRKRGSGGRRAAGGRCKGGVRSRGRVAVRLRARQVPAHRLPSLAWSATAASVPHAASRGRAA